MPIARFQLEDGRVARFEVPEGTSPEQAQQMMQAHFQSSTPAEQPAVTGSGATASDIMPPKHLQPDSFLSRVAGGIASTGLGIGQLGAHLIPGIDPSGMDERVRQFEQGRQAGAPSGVDWGNITGQGIATAPAALIAAPGEAGLALKALYNAGQGAITGLTQPVTSGDYASEKTKQGTIGGVAGGIGGTGLQVVGNAIGRAVTKLKQAVNAPSLEEISGTVKSALAEHGIDFDKLSDSVKASVLGQTRDALKVGAPVNAEETARHAAYADIGATPTLGQITQNPTQYQKELYLRTKSGGAPLATQYTDTVSRLAQALRDMQGKGPQPLNNPEAGAALVGPLRAYDQRINQPVQEGYGKFVNMPEAEIPVIPSKKVASATLKDLTHTMSFGRLPSRIQSRLSDMANGDVTEKMSPKQAEGFLQQINDEIETAAKNGPSGQLTALQNLAGSVKGWISQTPETGVSSATFSGSAVPSAKPAIDQIMTARALAADRFSQHDMIPALKAVVNGSYEPDTFVRKFVTGPTATFEDVSNLKKLLQKESPEVWNQVKAQVVDQINQSATKGAPDKFMQSQFAKELASLKKSGKLDLFFTPDEQQKLTTIGLVGKSLEGPQGASRTGLGGAGGLSDDALNFVTKLGLAKLPYVGPAAMNGRDYLVSALRSREALNMRPAGVNGEVPEYLRRALMAAPGGSNALAQALMNNQGQ